MSVRCKVQGCRKCVHARGVCGMHYRQQLRARRPPYCLTCGAVLGGRIEHCERCAHLKLDPLPASLCECGPSRIADGESCLKCGRLCLSAMAGAL